MIVCRESITVNIAMASSVKVDTSCSSDAQVSVERGSTAIIRYAILAAVSPLAGSQMLSQGSRNNGQLA
jgi:hypothetical protein